MQPVDRFDKAAQSVPDAEHNFVMLGTIHRDPEGHEALARWLRSFSPDVITLEFSRYGLNFRQTNGDHLRAKLCRTIRDMGLEIEGHRNGCLEGLFSYIDLPYEFTTVSEYTQENEVPAYLVDIDLFSRLKLREIDAMMSRGNIEALLHSPVRSSMSVMSSERVLADLYFRRATKAFTYTEEMRIRDNFMKDRISLLMQHHGPGRYVHVCGWQHLSDPHGIYKILKPAKAFVYDRTVRI